MHTPIAVGHSRAQIAAFIFVLISYLTAASVSKAAPLPKPENPWHAITDFQTDPEHGFLLRSPFDDMSDVQLVALPKGNRIHYNAPSKCVPAQLKSVLSIVAAKFGPVTVNSTVRSQKKNRKVGGKKKSWHLRCAAVDFRVHGKTKGLLSFLSKNPSVGGYKRYRAGFYHIDNGPKRTW